jgi:hypothetical protein
MINFTEQSHDQRPAPASRTRTAEVCGAQVHALDDQCNLFPQPLPLSAAAKGRRQVDQAISQALSIFPSDRTRTVSGISEFPVSVLWAATLPDDGPRGGLFRDGQPIGW